MVRHPDFERVRSDFMDIRNGHEGEYLYARFLSEYGLDDSKSYDLRAQKKMQEYALRSPTHLTIKKKYHIFGPGYWDSFITGVRKAIVRRVKLRSDHPVKFSLRNLRGRRVNVRLGEGVPVVVEPVSQPMRIRLSNPAKLRVRNLGERKLQIKFVGGDN